MKGSVLVTGGRGYLGGRIARHLASSGDVTVIVGTRAPDPKTANPVQVQLDMTSDASMADACNGVKAIVHLAAVNEVDSVRDPELALVVNTIGTMKLLRAAVQQGVKRFIYMSTAHVYGHPLEGVFDESSVTRPVHPYSITHRAAEDFVLAAHDRGEVEGLVLRLSNGFGAPAALTADRWTLLVNDLCRQAVVDRELRLKSSGEQKRDFVCMSDIERAVEHVLMLDRSMLKDGLFNLGGANVMSILEMTRLIQSRCLAVLGFEPPIHKPESSDVSDASLEFSIEKLRSTGWVPEGDPGSEVDETLRFCQAHFTE